MSRMMKLALILSVASFTLTGCATKQTAKRSAAKTKPPLYCKPLAQLPLELVPGRSSGELTILKKRLQVVLNDIEAYRLFAENFRKNGNTQALEQLNKPVDDFLAKHVDTLLASVLERKNLETVQPAAEITFRKARLLQYLGRIEAARKTAAELSEKGPYGAYQKLTVALPGDVGTTTTTVGEGYRALDADLSKPAETEKTGQPEKK